MEVRGGGRLEPSSPVRGPCYHTAVALFASHLVMRFGSVDQVAAIIVVVDR